MRFYIHTLGCKVNRAESETIAATLIAAGWEQVAHAAECELAIVNTCTVTGEADAKNRKLIRSLLRETHAPILVTGCAINIDAGHYADIDPRVTCESDKSKIPEVAPTLISVGAAFHAARGRAEDSPLGHSERAGNERPLSVGTHPISVETNPLSVGTHPISVGTHPISVGAGFHPAPGRAIDSPLRHFERSEPKANEVEKSHDGSQAQIMSIRASHGDNFRTRVDLKIQDGCDNACSYCIVHTARGPARSVPADKVLEQAGVLAQHGVQELVLVGIDLAAYKDGGTNLSQLVRMLQDKTDVARIRISSVEPQSVTPSLIESLGQSTGRLCRHLHLCLQSGSSKVLEEMNRHYNAEEFLDLVRHMREASPTLALSTDVIVGFPGETDTDFEQTCELVRQCEFMRLHVFRYSKRPGTPAAEHADQIDSHVMAVRSQILQDIGRELALQDMQRRLGMHEQIVIERPGLGTSESFHTVACDKSLEVGSLVNLTFTDIDERHLRLIG